MELYLIRHGETVDNVAGLYAGVRDSALTNHGVEQARRLGQHFATNGVKFTHIFASPLSRALKTAQAVATAQPKSDQDATLEIIQVPELIEQDFGYYEGKPFHARSDPKKTGREAHRGQNKDEPCFVDVESKESMNKRAETFLDEHVMALFRQSSGSEKHIVAVVSHGILLSHLWRRTLRRLPPKSITVIPEITAARGSLVLEHLGGWSNTGYLELVFSQDAVDSVTKEPDTSEPGHEGPEQGYTVVAGTSAPTAPNPTNTTGSSMATNAHILIGWSLLIRGIDRKEHLVGLKRQRGGIGRTAHDEKQRKIHSFFKRPRTS